MAGVSCWCYAFTLQNNSSIMRGSEVCSTTNGTTWPEVASEIGGQELGCIV